MLGDKDIHVDIAVSNMAASKKFYIETLGLSLLKEWDNEIYLKSGDSKLKLYLSKYAGTNKATYASWDVDNVKEIVEQLKAKGVVFEKYDMPGVTHEGEVHVWGKMKSAWLKDPDGNILCIGNNTIVA